MRCSLGDPLRGVARELLTALPTLTFPSGPMHPMASGTASTTAERVWFAARRPYSALSRPTMSLFSSSLSHFFTPPPSEMHPVAHVISSVL